MFMNAPAGLLTPDPFSIAVNEVNAWRGRCLVAFTRAELAVTEALVRLSELDATVPLPHLAGERYATLVKQLRKRGDAPDTIVAIETFQANDELRSFLCHGVVRVLLDRHGEWQAVFTLLMLLRQKPDRQVLLVGAAQADAILHKLKRDQGRLENKIRSSVPPSSTAATELQIVRNLAPPPSK